MVSVEELNAVHYDHEREVAALKERITPRSGTKGGVVERYWVPSEILFDDDIGKPRDTEVVTFADHAREVAALKEQIEEYERRLNPDGQIDVHGWIASLRGQVAALKEQIAQLTRERDLQKEVADNQAWWVRKLRPELEQAQADLTTLRKEHDDAKQIILGLDANLTTLRTELAQLTRERDELSEQVQIGLIRLAPRWRAKR
jgi:DNA repair exonuclease SbcCD ATPase subunit